MDLRCNGLVDGHCSEVHWISTLSARETKLPPPHCTEPELWIRTLSARETKHTHGRPHLPLHWISALSVMESKQTRDSQVPNEDWISPLSARETKTPGGGEEQRIIGSAPCPLWNQNPVPQAMMSLPFGSAPCLLGKQNTGYAKAGKSIHPIRKQTFMMFMIMHTMSAMEKDGLSTCFLPLPDSIVAHSVFPSCAEVAKFSDVRSKLRGRGTIFDLAAF